jgi:hypothetical protein
MNPRIRRATLFVILSLGMVLSLGSLVGQQPGKYSPPVVAGGTALQPVAYINGTQPVSQEEFGRFLMDRGGVERLETYVNIKIIEQAAAARGITATKLEMEAALNEDIASIPGNIPKSDFIKVVLPRYGKTYFEWMEDVIRPKILLTKMVRERVKVKEEDLKIQFERRYGEMRRCQMLLWPKADEKFVTQRFENARKSQDEFDREARAMVNPSLAAAAGHIKPITKHLVAEDKIVETTAFSLKVGEVSQVIATSQGYMVLKLHEIVPANTTVNYEAERPKLEKAAFDELLTTEIPKFFAELKAAAKPELYFKGPSDWRTPTSLNDVPSVIRQTGSNVPSSAPQPPAPSGTVPAGLPAVPK